MSDLVEYKDRGLEFTRKPESLDEMKLVGDAIGYFRGNLPWLFADWVNIGQNIFGESFSQLLPDIGRSKKTLITWVYVGKRIPFPERKYNLDFSFYAEVAKLDKDKRDSLLSEAEVEQWSVAQLRQIIKGQPTKKRKEVECPSCGNKFEI